MPFRYRPCFRSTVALAWALVIFAWPAPGEAADPSDAGKKSETLLAAMHRIDDMRLAISSKRTRAEQVQDFVRNRAVDLVEEIRRRLQVLNIDALDQAIKDDRIRFDLRLLGHLRAYGDVLAERIAFFELGDHRLAFYFAQAEDDIKMIRALSDLEGGELIAHITEAMADYRQAVDAPLMDAERISIPPLPRIWSQILSAPIP